MVYNRILGNLTIVHYGDKPHSRLTECQLEIGAVLTFIYQWELESKNFKWEGILSPCFLKRDA